MAGSQSPHNSVPEGRLSPDFLTCSHTEIQSEICFRSSRVGIYWRMHSRALIFSLLVGLCSSTAFAELHDIDPAKLSNAESIDKTYREVLALEPYVKHWEPKSPKDAPRRDSRVKTLAKAIDQLKSADHSNPDQEELVLLLGMVAQYGHNVDIDGAAQLGIDSYKRAHTIAPSDIRPDWFLGIHQCEYGDLVGGMTKLLATEQQAKKGSLPATFWDDYLTCATVSNMPFHALHAIQQIRASGVVLSHRQSVIEETNNRLFIQSIQDKEYDSKQVWSVEQNDKSQFVFTSEICGLRFRAAPTWGLKQFPVKNSQCAILIQVGPHDTPGGPMYPNILLIARPAKRGETIEEFSQTLQGDNTFRSAEPRAAQRKLVTPLNR